MKLPLRSDRGADQAPSHQHQGRADERRSDPVRKQRDSAFMIRVAGVVVKPLVCRRVGRQHGKQEHQRDQKKGTPFCEPVGYLGGREGHGTRWVRLLL